MRKIKSFFLTVAGATVILELFLLVRRKIRRQVGPLPGPIPWLSPFLSMLHAKERDKEHARLVKKYGSIVSKDSVFYTSHIISDMELIRYILKDPHGVFRNRNSNPIFGYFTPEGLLALQTDAQHKRHRSILSQMFTDTYLQHYIKIMRVVTQRLMDRYEREGGTLDIAPDLNSLTLDILGCAVLGHDFEALQGKAKGYFDRETLGPQIIYLLLIGAFPRWLQPLIPVPKLKKQAYEADQKIRDLISHLVAKAQQGNLDPKCLLSILMNVKPPWTPMELHSELSNFIFAGHETTANTLTFAFHLLSFHPDMQQKMREEIKLAGGVEHVEKLHYCWCAFRETLRLYPTVKATVREASRTVTLPGPQGVTIGRNDVVLLNWVPVSRDPTLFQDPDQFCPDRWLATTNRSEAFAHVPNFGGGLRQCIGQRFAEEEGVLILASVVERFVVEPGNQTQETIETGNAITLYAMDKIALKMRPVGGNK